MNDTISMEQHLACLAEIRKDQAMDLAVEADFEEALQEAVDTCVQARDRAGLSCLVSAGYLTMEQARETAAAMRRSAKTSAARDASSGPASTGNISNLRNPSKAVKSNVVASFSGSTATSGTVRIEIAKIGDQSKGKREAPSSRGKTITDILLQHGVRKIFLIIKFLIFSAPLRRRPFAATATQ